MAYFNWPVTRSGPSDGATREPTARASGIGWPQHASTGCADQLTLAHDELPTQDGRHCFAAGRTALVRVVIILSVQAGRLDHSVPVQVEHSEVRVGADEQSALARVQPPHSRWSLRGRPHVRLQRHLARVDRFRQKQAHARLNASEARLNVPDT